MTMEKCAALGVEVVESTVWEHGSKGGLKLAEKVVEIMGKVPSNFHHLYEDSMPLWDKIEIVATKIYRAGKVETDKRVRNKLAALEKAGYGHLPVCMAKTQYSFSSDPTLLGACPRFRRQKSSTSTTRARSPACSETRIGDHSRAARLSLLRSSA